MATYLRGALYGTDYKDSFQLLRHQQTYNYTLTASGGGRVAFKVEQWKVEPSHGPVEKWYVIEEKSKVQSGTTLNGTFTVSVEPGEAQSSILLTFTREFLSAGVDFELSFAPA